MISLLKRPSAWIPIALTVAMLLVMWMYLAHIIPPDPAEDEGAGAHLFQMWILFELFSVLFFAFRWIPRAPREGMQVLVLQIALALAPLGIVFSQHW